VELSFNERRVLGVLIEKAFTTPDQYPLTLNSVVTASNQKSCRNPVTRLAEDDVLDSLQSLRSKGLCSLVQPAGGRTERWRQLAREALKVSGKECAVLGELLLRGPQTDGELRQNSSRMVPIESLQALQEVLHELASREDPLIRCLSPETRKRGRRYVHNLYPEPELQALLASPQASDDAALAGAPGAGAAPPPSEGRLAPEQAGDRGLKSEGLSAEVALLREEISALKERVSRLESELGVAG
jgi:uncharacterized protein YceH (UPF0502 family)